MSAAGLPPSRTAVTIRPRKLPDTSSATAPVVTDMRSLTVVNAISSSSDTRSHRDWPAVMAASSNAPRERAQVKHRLATAGGARYWVRHGF